MNHQNSFVNPALPPAYRLALLASLARDQEAADAFNCWQTVVDVDDLPTGQFTLLPLICRNLELLGIDHPWRPRLKGVYRKIWYTNQLILQTLAEVLTALEGNGIPTMLVGSAALALTVYPESAYRPIAAPEIVVPAHLAEVAVTRLQAAGWQTPQTNPNYLVWQPGRRFTNRAGRALQLLPLTPVTVPDTAWWNRAIPLAVENAATKTLAPTDHLLWVCWQAAWHVPISLIDAAQLIRQNPVDWPRLLETARNYRLGLPTAHSLNILAALMQSPIPPDILSALAQIPARYYERQAHAAQLTPPAHRTSAQRFWLHYARYRWAGEYGGLGFTPVSLAGYARAAWQQRQMNRQNNNGANHRTIHK